MSNDRDRTLALAGIYQAADLAQSLARTGHFRDESMTVMVASLLAISADDTEAIYGGVAGLVPGLRVVHNRIGTQAEITDFELGRYVFSLMQLAGRLAQNATMAGVIEQRVNELREAGITETLIQSSGVPDDEFTIAGSTDVFDYFASTYSDTISHLVPQIIVHGEHGYLADENIVNRVRTSLLAGIRSAYLWNQLGGRKWHLIFQKGRYVDQSRRLLAEIGVSPLP